MVIDFHVKVCVDIAGLVKSNPNLKNKITGLRN